MAASMLLEVGDRWSTTATDAGKSAGSWLTSRRRLSTPPADAPIATRLVSVTASLLARRVCPPAYTVLVEGTTRHRVPRPRPAEAKSYVAVSMLIDWTS